MPTVYVNDENATNRMPERASSGGKFSSLLKGVVNEIKIENDQAYAADTQVNEALVLINEWMQVSIKEK